MFEGIARSNATIVSNLASFSKVSLISSSLKTLKSILNATSFFPFLNSLSTSFFTVHFFASSSFFFAYYSLSNPEVYAISTYCSSEVLITSECVLGILKS
jgi:hypothetical protein